ncbi:ABC-type phosphate transport system, ATPase component [Methanoregula formicica SMSP]|uniref:ABC-type phosphate transport system, ATPase component n=1 Tax=Methanoregula formicica (strain DSM 22288 / NBRC 105244 / SMSP) TaxID=593750 RepID=L0HEG6_METFS|nr:ABC-type phosphate transport system, ATPase component [Methanoregula formicica SMSP]
MSETGISVKNLNVSIDNREILKNISTEIPKNQITVIIGPSGCGKSTLLRSINRMTDLVENVKTEGEILINGNNVLDPATNLSDLRKNVGMIAQAPNPLPMSIYDNVVYGPKIHGMRDPAILDEKVELSLKRVGLWDEVHDRLKDPASALSLGQQQRLCLARALAVGPKILLCDETTSALDPLSAKHIEDELISLRNDYTIVFVTHILRQAKRLADYAVFLYLGEVVECGPAHEVFTSPKDPRTKAYLEGVFG